MTPEIKHRIEQIKRGEVPAGYKKTKVGIVPIAWEETRFNKKFSRINRKNTEGNTNVLTISAQYGLINQEEFFNKSVASEDKSTYFLLRNGEYAYNKSYSSGYPFGALKRLERYDSGVVSPLYICFATTSENKCPDFYSQYFEAGKMNSEIQAFAQEGARNHGLLNISVDDFFNSILIAPPLAEQKKIAEILAAQDKVIALKEKLLEEKKKQKKYLMQQLLTGKKRLSGFSGEWKRRKLSEITFAAGRRNKGNLPLEPFAVTNDKGFIAQRSAHDDFGYMNNVDRSAYMVVKPNSFAYNPARINVGSIGYYDGKEDVIVSSLYEIFQTVDDVDDRFLWHWFKSSELMKWIKRLQEGSVRFYFYYDKLEECSLMMPSLAEQQKISECIDTMDRCIEISEYELDEERQKKKALMQLLLAGIVRV